jgi:hypothetical protein
LNLSHQHGSLHGSDAKISQLILLEVRPDEFIPSPISLPMVPKWAAPLHAKTLLRFDLSEEPRFEILTEEMSYSIGAEPVLIARKWFWRTSCTSPSLLLIVVELAGIRGP